MSRASVWTDAPGVSSSVRACREVTRARARNFAFALRLAPEPKRSALYALYAWTRAADDIADGPGSPEERRTALASFGERTRAALADDGPAGASPDADDAAIWPAVTAAARAYALDPAHFMALLDGMAQDLGPVAIETEADLRAYCYRVASTVGLLCVSVWGLRANADHAAAERLASLRGRAFQLTNILRDFAEDFDADPRRVYLPAESFRHAGLTPERLRSWDDPAACARFVEQWALLARGCYEESALLDRMVSADGVAVLRGLTGVYRALLDRLADDPKRVGAGPCVRVPKAVKLCIAARAVAARGSDLLSGRRS